jgi:transposase
LHSDRKKWKKAVVILDSFKGKAIADIESKIKRSRRKINSWISLYESKGVEGLLKPRRRINRALIKNIETKKRT